MGLDYKVTVLLILAVADVKEVYSGNVNEKARGLINLLFKVRTSDVLRFNRFQKIWPFALSKAKAVYQKRAEDQNEKTAK